MGKNAELSRQWFEEVWNQGRVETIDAMCEKDVIGHGTGHDGDIRGIEQFKEFWNRIRDGFSEMHFSIEQIVEGAEMTAVRWNATMAHTGRFMGIEPTGKRVNLTGTSIQKFAGGKICEGWDNWDKFALLSQLGAISVDQTAMETPKLEITA